MFKRVVPLLFGLVLAGVVACTSAVPAATPPPTPASAPTPIPTATPRPASFPLQIVGSDGVAVTLASSPDRIVAVDSAAVEILFALGHGRRVAATHTFVDYPPETAAVPRVGNAFALNLEQIAALNPDLVYTFFDRFVPELRKLGVPVLYLKPPSTFEEAAEHMRMWGRITGDPEGGERLASGFEASLEDIRGRVGTPVTRPRVYQDVAPNLWTLGAGSLADEVFRVLRAENVFADISGAGQVSAEEIIARAPEVIVSVYPDGAAAWRVAGPFAALPAVKADRICEVDGAKLSVAGTRLVEGVLEVAECLYPDRF